MQKELQSISSGLTSDHHVLLQMADQAAIDSMPRRVQHGHSQARYNIVVITDVCTVQFSFSLRVVILFHHKVPFNMVKIF